MVWTCLIAGVVWLSATPVSAVMPESSPDPTPEPDSPSLIYIVQPGDTLYGIAQRYDLSVDLLATTNNITNPALISVGDRLVIPPPPKEPQVKTQHRVRPGETLHTLSLEYGLSPLDIAHSNYLVRPDAIAVDQNITIEGSSPTPQPLTGNTHTVQTGDSLIGIALEYQTSPWTLLTANHLSSAYLAAPSNRLLIPAETGTFLDWPSPYMGIDIHPTPAIQGQTISIQISLTTPALMNGSFLGVPMNFFPERQVTTALVGIPVNAEIGLSPLIITTSVEGGEPVVFSQHIPLAVGDFGDEIIIVPDEIAAAMTEEVVKEELKLLDQLFTAQTETRWWNSYFTLPSAGDITSRFGTRRNYNVPHMSPYHTGTDFWRSSGTPVTAPADGIVVSTNPLIVRGNVVIIDHGWGVLTGYWHLSDIHVTEGEQVTQGQLIGNIGNTGLSTGPHLHWEMRVRGVPVDALQWVREEFP